MRLPDMRTLYERYFALTPADRQSSYWKMSRETYDAFVERYRPKPKLPDPMPLMVVPENVLESFDLPPTSPDAYLLGRPIQLDPNTVGVVLSFDADIRAPTSTP